MITVVILLQGSGEVTNPIMAKYDKFYILVVSYYIRAAQAGEGKY